MNGVELYFLGQRLMRIGGDALSEDSRLRRLSPGAWLIFADVVVNRRTSVREIALRTGLPRDHVSSSVSRLADDGLLEIVVASDGWQSIIVHRALRLGEAGGAADSALAAALDTQLAAALDTRRRAGSRVRCHLGVTCPAT